MQLVMIIALVAEDLLRLNDFGREAVAVHNAVRTRTSLDKLGRNAQMLEIAVLLDGIVPEYLQEF